MHSFKSQRVGDETESVIIEITRELPNFSDNNTAERYQIDAAKIAQALWSSLPGGTFDQLVIALLDHTKSRYRISYPSK